jgi:prepilin-type N-terminal cleavage/methylation domain-containing protein
MVRRRGYTLVETLVALAVTGVLLTALGATMLCLLE